jgi:nicotinate phosphoribosyltransferase
MDKHQFSFNEDHLALMEYASMYIGNKIWLENGKGNEETTFELTIRDQPKNWGFFLFYGLDRFLAYIKSFRFSEEEIKLLKKMKLIDDAHEEYYKNFRFSGDVWSIEDGTPFFAGEPILRITGTMLETNLMTALVLNAFSYPVRILTKINRERIAVGKKTFTSGGSVRMPGFEQIIIGQAANILAGSKPGIQPIAYTINEELGEGPFSFSPNITHATIKSFDSEREAFRYTLQKIVPIYPKVNVMIDTYNTRQGIKKFIEEAKKVPQETIKQMMVTVDSGDLVKDTKYVRKELDKHKMNYIGITACSNLDEYRIKALEDKGAPIDYYVGVSEIMNISDAPILEAVYKMSEVRYPDGRIEYKAKLAEGKESYPSRKQIFRVFDKKGVMRKDIIGREEEKLGEPMLKLQMKNGERVTKPEDLFVLKKRIEDNLDKMPKSMKEIYAKHNYPVVLSPKLKRLYIEVAKKHLEAKNKGAN